MKNIKVLLAVLLLGTIQFADAQYYPGPPGPPPGPAPRERRERHNDEAAEVTPPTGYFEISVGAAEPIGSFSNTGSTSYGGYALPGVDLAISLGIPINHSNFGIALMYKGTSNPFDINGYMNNVQYSDPSKNYYIPTDQYGNPYDQGMTYDNSFIMAGLFATYPIQRLSIDFRLMGGVAICSLPELAYAANATSPTATNDFSWDISGSNTSGFAFGVGADLRYKFRRVSLMLGVDFLTADPNISTNETYVDQDGTTTYSRVGGGLPISLMSYSIGIGYTIR
jgi:hypothetical protein